MQQLGEFTRAPSSQGCPGVRGQCACQSPAIALPRLTGPSAQCVCLQPGPFLLGTSSCLFPFKGIGQPCKAWTPTARGGASRERRQPGPRTTFLLSRAGRAHLALAGRPRAVQCSQENLMRTMPSKPKWLQVRLGQAGGGVEGGSGPPWCLVLSSSSFPRSAMLFPHGGLRAQAAALPGPPFPEGGAHRGTGGKHREVHLGLQGEWGPLGTCL